MLGIDIMRELDLNNEDKQKARMSVYQHYDDIEVEIIRSPVNKGLVKRLEITSLIIANINKIF